MIETWRWFGPDDPVTLKMIRQTGVSGIVTSLHHIPAGETWPRDEIRKRRQEIEEHGLKWSVVESVPVHGAIKAGEGDTERLLDNYCETLTNLGAEDVAVVCYNFMPVVDWTRTNLSFDTASTAKTLRFDVTEFAAYDIFVLERKEAAADYAPSVVARAEKLARSLDEERRQALERNIIAGLPGGYGSYSREEIAEELRKFARLGEKGYRKNLYRFIERILPAAEAAGIRLCIHPDDPPVSLFGLPRVMSTAKDAQALFERYPSSCNGLTLCAGSFGARADNDLLEMARMFGSRIYFTHLRNVTREEDGSFVEAAHLDGDTDMVGLIGELMEEERRRLEAGRGTEIPFRPDHGFLIGEEQERANINPGYSFAGRLMALAELRGVIHALSSRGASPDA